MGSYCAQVAIFVRFSKRLEAEFEGEKKTHCPLRTHVLTKLLKTNKLMLAERVGFEPTCPCGQDAFEAPPLRPLRYLSVLTTLAVGYADSPPALAYAHSTPLALRSSLRSVRGGRRRA